MRTKTVYLPITVDADYSGDLQEVIEYALEVQALDKDPALSEITVGAPIAKDDVVVLPPKLNDLHALGAWNPVIELVLKRDAGGKHATPEFLERMAKLMATERTFGHQTLRHGLEETDRSLRTLLSYCADAICRLYGQGELPQRDAGFDQALRKADVSATDIRGVLSGVHYAVAAQMHTEGVPVRKPPATIPE